MNNLHLNDFESRIQTADSCEMVGKISYGYSEAYKELQFKHKELEHQYAILENEYELYTSETYNKITNLEKDMDKIVQEKDRAYKTLQLENKNLKEENLVLKNEILNLKTQIERSNAKVGMKQIEFKSAALDFQKMQTKNKQIIMDLENKVRTKSEQIQNLKEALNCERMTIMSKDQLLATKDKQIAQMIAEIKTLSYELESQRQVQETIKDTNYRLKRQLEELRAMFAEMETGLRNCEQCRALEIKNMELSAIIKGYKDRDRQREYSFNSSHYNRKSLEPNYEPSGLRRPSSRKYLTDITVSNINPFNEYTPPVRSLKQSVVRRCKNIIDRN